ncbi:oxidoreductase [Mycobacterium ahvazicum]|uniref:Oxidoreductase n=1 Tax=Mycobacterium ahvazicum TaxID=1964395 RepID=A0A2K4YG43_9MYCO|nr:oxidoreductase [Mycobacterium ahvazicum]
MAAATSNQRMIAGVAAAAVSLGVAALVAIPFGARADARAAVGSMVVDLTPGPVKEWAIQTLGSLDKAFLGIVVLVVIATIAAVAGSFETKRRPVGSAVIAAAGILGCAAVLSRQGATLPDTIPTVAGAVSGVAALRLLTRRFAPRDPDGDEPDARRRAVLVYGLLGFGVVSGVVGAVVTRLVHSVAADRNAVTLPTPRAPAPPRLLYTSDAARPHPPPPAHRLHPSPPTSNRKASRSRALSPLAATFIGWTPRLVFPNSATATGGCAFTAWWTAKPPTALTTCPVSMSWRRWRR